nr:hypothetical protein [uncultured Desulfuromonas sp.]
METFIALSYLYILFAVVIIIHDKLVEKHNKREEQKSKSLTTKAPNNNHL